MGDLRTLNQQCRDLIPRPQDYDVDEQYGFLVKDPLEKLPEYFAPWNELAANLPDLIAKHLVRDAVTKLPELDHCQLVSRSEKLCAYTFLGFISHAYVWQEGDTGAAKVLPRQLAVPFYAVSTDLGLPPVITYTSFALANWKFTGSNRCLDLSNVQSLVCHYPEKASGWFMITSWFVEVTFIPAVKAITKALHAVVDMNSAMLATNLSQIATVITEMKQALTRTHDHLEARAFYQSVRPFLYGWGGEGTPLPEGLIYDGVSSEPIKASGGSGAQSSTIHCLDAVLGIRHAKEKEVYLRSVRKYMPPKHAKFIEALERAPSIREFVKNAKNIDLQKAFDSVVNALIDFRCYHIQLITKYIVIQSGKTKKGVQDYGSTRGTGETSVLPFLKSIRNSTRANKLENNKTPEEEETTDENDNIK